MDTSINNQEETLPDINSADDMEAGKNEMKNELEDTVEISGEGAAKAAEAATETEEIDVEVDIPSEDEAPAENADSLRNELTATKDRLLRQIAEFQNYRRRTEQEKNMLIQAGKAQVIQQMLELMDDFTRSIEAANLLEEQQESVPPMYRSLKDGVVMVFDKFKGELERLGVEPIEAVGHPFNENEHEALMQQPAPDNMEAGTVVEEIQKGYRLGDRVLRHSRVIVAA